MAIAGAVEKAVNALLKWRDFQSHLQKPKLLEEDELLYLIVSLKKIPQKPRVNPVKVPLPHPLIDPSSGPAELCMFIDDRPKSGVTKDATSKKIKAENIPVTKDYPPSASVIGEAVLQEEEDPCACGPQAQNWKEQIEKACSSAMLFLGSGTCCVVKVAKLSLGKKEIAKNVEAAINGIADVVPNKWGNIRSFHLKLLDSLALPVYQAMPDLRLKILAEPEHPTSSKEEKQEVEEEKEDASHQKKKKKNKGRIHEVQYMDDQENINDSNSGADIKDEITTETISTKKKKSALKKLSAVDTKVKDKKKKKKVAAY
ncbi:Detected protein of unknown function [Hibiscus syriacus]|uniref:Ribosomal protein L1p/L10e family n=1 Tax=Hibiscus syriacus TaxID=106335 RepID=A0A6A3BZD9_HIBSY|nr:Detected protein of unknown function [Hibiscus syriacus]